MNYSNKEILTKGKFELINFLPKIGVNNVRDEIILGLKSKNKYISPKFFYDELGSELFEKITQLYEYYPTRTEQSILSSIVSKLDLDYSNLNIIELGSGDCSKIRLLLNQIPENKISTINYYPVDISQSAISKASEELIYEFPAINIHGIVADFINQLNLIPKTGNRLFCFFGSTIGNLNIRERQTFIELLGNELQVGDSFLLGMDMVKETSILESAYNDAQQLTADFNKNVLNVVNDLVGTDFNKDDFEHFAFYNKAKNRIEMHLKAFTDIEISVNSISEIIQIKKGETIHTENPHKFTSDDINTIAEWGNFNLKNKFTDDNNLFSLVHFRK